VRVGRRRSPGKTKAGEQSENVLQQHPCPSQPISHYYHMNMQFATMPIRKALKPRLLSLDLNQYLHLIVGLVRTPVNGSAQITCATVNSKGDGRRVVGRGKPSSCCHSPSQQSACTPHIPNSSTPPLPGSPRPIISIPVSSSPSRVSVVIPARAHPLSLHHVHARSFRHSRRRRQRRGRG
jgi:hypothetical protein